MSRFIILGAGKPENGEYNPSLMITEGSQTFLKWQVDLAKFLNCHQIDYIGGYQLKDIQRLESGINYISNPYWQDTGAIGSLFMANLSDDEDLYICYNDVLIDEKFLIGKNQAHPYALIDTTYPNRYKDAPLKQCELIPYNNNLQYDEQAKEKAEFVGFLYIPKGYAYKVLGALNLDNKDLKTKHLSSLFKLPSFQSTVNLIDAHKHWCDLNVPQNISRFIFGTKAQALKKLFKIVEHSKVLDQITFSCQNWWEEHDNIIGQVINKFPSQRLVVRSSALSEDGFVNSNAGRFHSFVDIACTADQIKTYVEKVIKSYGQACGDDQVLIQPFLEVSMHGVCLTRTYAGGPYYVINYHQGRETDIITGGKSENHECVYILKNSTPQAISLLPPLIKKILSAIKEIESLTHNDCLDIEFGIDNEENVYILQVRPLVLQNNLNKDDDILLLDAIDGVKNRFSNLEIFNGPGEEVTRRVWGVMPDWNPAEIIGRKPNPLAFSLYEELVTNETWALQRREFGYKDLSSIPLMRSFGGVPYIDVAASFYSFIPANASKQLASKIVNFCLDHLKNNPHLHDKVEFSVIPTCYCFDFSEYYQYIFKGASLTSKEADIIQEEYKLITSKAIKDFPLYYSSVAENSLKDWQLISSDPLELSFILLDKCKRGGVLPFAHLARCAFIAVMFLKSLVRKKVITEGRLAAFYHSINTISRELSLDAWHAKQGTLSIAEFSEKYGHLRPGTYDICSPKYADQPHTFILPLIENAKKESKFEFNWTPEEAASIKRELSSFDNTIDIEEFTYFLRTSIAGREYAKFVFTKVLSLILDCIVKFGETFSLNREDLAFLSIDDLRKIRSNLVSSSQKTFLDERIENNKRNIFLESKIELPSLICSKNDIGMFFHPHTEPNYITQKTITAAIADDNILYADLAGKIVVLKNADPGFDWIFGKNIAALITLYGGVNSHMAIRSAEFDLPAAIGVGEKIYNEILKAQLVELSCNNKTIRVVS